LKTFCLSLHQLFRSFLEETIFTKFKKIEDMNRVTLIGNLGKDPEVRRLENGAAVGKFNIATTENYKDTAGEWQSQTEWHEIVVWRAQAELTEKFLKKGTGVYVEGKLAHRKWTDKNNIERYTTEVVASIVRPLERTSPARAESNFPTQEPPMPSYDRAPNGSNSGGSSQMSNQSVPFEVVEPANMGGGSEPVGEDGLPF
jgi:single-strand DNA-binding protein